MRGFTANPKKKLFTIHWLLDLDLFLFFERNLFSHANVNLKNHWYSLYLGIVNTKSCKQIALNANVNIAR